MNAAGSVQSRDRIVGLDVARALAIGGMALIHFASVLSATQMEATSFGWFIDRISGRPAAVFMILAGIGVSLRLANGSDEARTTAMQRSLWKRGLFFLVVGFLNLIFWPGDILRVYGIAYLLAAALVLKTDRWLWAAAATMFVSFLTMMFVVDFETNWDFATLDYANLWTASGAALNLFYNGFRAVLPWAGLFFVGMLIGRLNLRDVAIRRRLMWAGGLLWLATEALSYGLLSATLPLVAEADREVLVAFLGTDSLPPMPLFLLSSSGLAILAIMLCIRITEQDDGWWWTPFISAGQMAFTWYIAHIAFVLGAGLVTEFRGDTPALYTCLAAVIFCDVMFALSWIYRKKYRNGPLEWVLRMVT